MGALPYWLLFVLVGIGAVLLGKRLDDRDRHLAQEAARRQRRPPPGPVPKDTEKPHT